MTRIYKPASQEARRRLALVMGHKLDEPGRMDMAERCARDTLRRIIGPSALRTLVAAHARQRIRVPSTATQTHPLCTMLGAQAFGHLVDALGGTVALVPPTAESAEDEALHHKILRLAGEKLRAPEIARRLDLTIRRVRELGGLQVVPC